MPRLDTSPHHKKALGSTTYRQTALRSSPAESRNWPLGPQYLLKGFILHNFIPAHPGHLVNYPSSENEDQRPFLKEQKICLILFHSDRYPKITRILRDKKQLESHVSCMSHRCLIWKSLKE